MPLKVFLKKGVESFIFKGADLMWPGCINIESGSKVEEYKKD